METGAKGLSGSLVFNPQLFIINGEPLKFSLHGFSSVEFSSIVKIIEAFGGQLSQSDAPPTLVFIDPTNSSRPSGEYYDIRFLENCIITQKLQNLRDYRLAAFTHQKVKRSAVDYESRNFHNGRQGKFRNRGYIQEYSTSGNDERFNRKQSRYHSFRRPAPLHYSESSPSEFEDSPRLSNNFRANINTNRPLQIKSDVTFRVPIVDYSSRNLLRINNNRRDSFSPKLHKPLVVNLSGRSVESDDDVQEENAYNNYASDDMREFEGSVREYYQLDTDKESQYISNDENDSPLRRWSDESFTELEERVNETYKIPSMSRKSTKTKKSEDDPTKYRLKKAASIQRIDEESELSEVEKEHPSRRIEAEDRNSVNEIIKPTNIDNASAKACKEDTVLLDVPERERSDDSSKTTNLPANKDDSLSTSSLQFNKSDKYVAKSQPEQQTGNQGKPMKYHRYTEEEDRRMVEYIVKRKAIADAGSKSLWREFLEDEKLTSIMPSPAALVHHFKSEIVKNYRKYIDDPDVAQEFKKIVEQKSWKGCTEADTENDQKSCKKHQYTDEEDRRLWKFLIDRNAIGEASKIGIWRKFLEHQLLSEPQPTAAALCMHFKQSLVKSYKNYITDPAVLKAIEEKYSLALTAQWTRSAEQKSKNSRKGGGKPSAKTPNKVSDSWSEESDLDAVAQKIELALGAPSSQHHEEAPPPKQKEVGDKIHKSKIDKFTKEKATVSKTDYTSSTNKNEQPKSANLGEKRERPLKSSSSQCYEGPPSKMKKLEDEAMRSENKKLLFEDVKVTKIDPQNNEAIPKKSDVIEKHIKTVHGSKENVTVPKKKFDVSQKAKETTNKNTNLLDDSSVSKKKLNVIRKLKKLFNESGESTDDELILGNRVDDYQKPRKTSDGKTHRPTDHVIPKKSGILKKTCIKRPQSQALTSLESFRQKIEANRNAMRKKRRSRVILPPAFGGKKMPWLKSFKIPRVTSGKDAETTAGTKNNYTVDEKSQSSFSERSQSSDSESSDENSTAEQIRQQENSNDARQMNQSTEKPIFDESVEDADKQENSARQANGSNDETDLGIHEQKQSFTAESDDSDDETGLMIVEQDLSDTAESDHSGHEITIRIDRNKPNDFVEPGTIDGVDKHSEHSYISKDEKSTTEEKDKSPSSALSPQTLESLEHKEPTLESNTTKKSCHIFSEEDNRRIIEYLIKNNAVQRVEGLAIWRKIVVDKVLGDARVTPFGLVGHFKRVLKYDYGKYTDDQDALKQFEQINSDNSW